MVNDDNGGKTDDVAESSGCAARLRQEIGTVRFSCDQPEIPPLLTQLGDFFAPRHSVEH